MVRSSCHLRPRQRRVGGAFLALLGGTLALALLAGPAAGQQPTRPDTVRKVSPAAPGARRPPQDTGRAGPAPATVPRDTGLAAQDTGAVRPDTGQAAQDTLPPPQLPELPRPVPAGFATGVWVFDRDSIERFSATVSLADLLDMIPGVATIRSGFYLQPQAVTSMGQTGGRIQVFLDGYELTPLDGGVLDLSRIALVELSSIRIERRLDVLRIELRSFSPATTQPYAYIQAGIAIPNSKLFRGVFLVPHFLFGPVAFGLERLDTDGTHRGEAADATTTWGKWSKIWRDRGGLQAEVRTSTTNRPQGVPWVGKYHRSDWILRGRWQFLPGVVAEASYGSSSSSEPRLAPDSTQHGFAVPLDPVSLLADSASQADTLRALADTVRDVSDRQLAAHIGVLHGPVWFDGALRTHTAAHLPGAEGDAALGLVRPGLGDVDAGIHLEHWSGRQLAESRLRARLGPYQGFSAFAEVSSGDRGVPILSDTVGDLFTHRRAWRAGVDLERSWISAGIARLSVTTDSITGFGLPFDPAARFVASGSMTGWESHARVRLFWKPLSAEYSYVAWTRFVAPSADTVFRQPPYVPTDQLRASLVYHQSPLPTGHLELYARLDLRRRGLMYDAVAPLTPVPTIDQGLDFYLQIRIMDLRIFFTEKDILQNTSQDLADLPLAFGRTYQGPRIFYGIRWQFLD